MWQSLPLGRLEQKFWIVFGARVRYNGSTDKKHVHEINTEPSETGENRRHGRMTNNEKLDLILETVISIDARVGRLEERMDRLEERMDRLEERMNRLEERMDRLEERMDHLEERMDHLEERVAGIEITLENETNRNIRIIAEGHLDVIRKLDDSLKVSQESEIYQLRVNHLDAEIKKIKEFYQNQSYTQRTAAN